MTDLVVSTRSPFVAQEDAPAPWPSHLEVEPGVFVEVGHPVFTAKGGKVYRRGSLVAHPAPLLSVLLADKHDDAAWLSRELAAAMGEARRQRMKAKA